ncbi:D-amino acid dehydrogenase small subunit [Gimesia panareensis]|uniref:D-amino acid dehydrogenase small subunit n=1 Tax=Gimesia panareensis TaxID=2527978 RepID=A0A517Q395_9PLAN|nr:FAD-dependent oxidoreductase [Gimesia panareensis]QDT26092.1 D-amino acid dehydrogenase small subunit [Gimesia panareensis]
MGRPRIVVLGAGLQGTCVALALAHRGHAVTLIESRPSPLSAASLRNEGKIHLGFVYALDQSGATQRKMLEGALCFAPLLDRWCGELPWHEWRSEGFLYAVMPDSIAEVGTLHASYTSLSALLSEMAEHELCCPGYLGRELSWLWRAAGEDADSPFDRGLSMKGFFETEEAAIDPRYLAARLKDQLRRHPLIELRCGIMVDGAERRAGGFRLNLQEAGESRTLDADLVANCTWSDRARIDATVGIPADAAPLCYRVKHQIMVEQTPGMRPLVPITMVQGPYGDVVPRRDGQVYISWYPECRTYFGELPPQRSLEDPEVAQSVAERSLSALQQWLPDLAGARILSSAAGVIVARGSTDIEDPQSALHRREAFGVKSYAGWWTVDTGKLTNAPQLGEITGAQINEAMK